MLKITGSNFNIYDRKDKKATIYLECVNDMLFSQEVIKLSNYVHHYFTNRFQHSLNVSYYSYSLSKHFGWDHKSSARAGLLHDLYFFDNTSTDDGDTKLLDFHPYIALKNSQEAFELNEIEENAIVNHMWPTYSDCNPKYKEAYLISFVDKYCATIEVVLGSLLLVKNTSISILQKGYSPMLRSYYTAKQACLNIASVFK